MIICLDAGNSNLALLSVDEARMILNISKPHLNRLINDNPIYDKWFWHHGEDRVTSRLMLACMQFELTGAATIDIPKDILSQIFKLAA